ncbi:hypothetical protein ER308_10270 [Egibacter rhizosphaerae]|uniref:UGSC-like domain-containing protein n=3 Tax=Egibacter rhizosphaerae TaxID=1670831 RepID=A0A411YFE6_9ACTN|nr:hypothetical protein [Egibacter rhizosphaerae]QBI19906.1 hypothetical protein ER308_10270 [Egibacter rhizosphaerae]
MSVLEGRGVPTVTLCTSQFAYEAAQQWQALGHREATVVEVRHPFGHLPTEEVRAEAERVVGEVVACLTPTGATR